jgi:dihydrolipoamide dehydrogenase
MIMPKLDMSMEEGKLLKWMCKEGDRIEKGDPVFEVETGKVNLEVEAIVEGSILKIYRNEGEVVDVNDPIAFIGQEGEEIPPLDNNAENEVHKEEPKDIEENRINEEASSNQYDLCVIGAGPGGYVATIRAAQLGAKVVVVEKEKLGGTCLNWGCIPTKALVYHADVWNKIKNAENYGFSTKDSSFDWGKIISRKDKAVSTLVDGVNKLFIKNKIKLIKGTAEILDKNKIRINTGAKEDIISTKNIIIATGTESSTVNIPTQGNVKLKDVKEILDLQSLPKKLCIIGGGVIGVEIASIFSTFGVEVSIVEMMPKLIPMMDNEVIDVLKQEFKGKGINIYTETTVEKIVENNKAYRIDLSNGKTIDSDEILVAIGRKPNNELFKNINIRTDKKGYIEVDNKLKTNIENIYAIGDITNKLQLAHVASHQGIVAVENMFGEEKEMKYDIVPNCIFTDPEIASVGITEEEAKNRKLPYKAFKFPFMALGKAVASDDTRGFIKIIADERWGEIIGAHIIGPDAAHLIAEVVAVMELEGTVYELADTIHAHPTLSEGIMEASAGILDKVIHI